MTKKETKTTSVQGTNVVTFSDEVLNKVRASKKVVTENQKDFRKELASNVAELERMYKEDYNSTKLHINYLCNISGCKPSDFFSVDFIKSLYKVYTFKVLAGEGVRTLIAEERNITEKTDFAKLSERCENCSFIGVSLDIKASKFELKKDGKNAGKFRYMYPVLNFSASNIIKHLLTLDAYTLGVASYKKAKKAELAKAKKAEKKAKKAEAKQAEANIVESK